MAGDFRRDRDHADRRDRQVLEHFVEHGGHRRVGLRAQLARIDVRPFQMHAQHARAARRALARDVAQSRDHVHQFVARRGHGGGEQAGGAVARMGASDRFDGVARFHHVGAAAAVHMQVDEARQDVGRVVLRRIGGLALDRRDASVFERQRAVDPAIRGENVSAQHENFPILRAATACARSVLTVTCMRESWRARAFPRATLFDVCLIACVVAFIGATPQRSRNSRRGNTCQSARWRAGRAKNPRA
jgi:hypothetical protein